jgi:hypothetical protein
LLVTAAGLKLSGLNVTALPLAGWIATPQVQVAAAEWEVVLGAWLLSGSAPFAAWLAALGTFLGFAIVSAYFGWIGVASCGCFGAIRTSPWTAFTVDVAAMLALVAFRPRIPRSALLARSASEGHAGSRLAPASGWVAIPLGAAAILLALTGIGSWIYGSPAAALAHLRGELLTVEPSYVDFGTVRTFETQHRQLMIYNWSDTTHMIVGSRSSCSCLSVLDLPIALPRKSSAAVTVELRFSAAASGVVSHAVQLWVTPHLASPLNIPVYWVVGKPINIQENVFGGNGIYSGFR